jgi:hypothetical protein
LGAAGLQSCAEAEQALPLQNKFVLSMTVKVIVYLTGTHPRVALPSKLKRQEYRSVFRK